MGLTAFVVIFVAEWGDITQILLGWDNNRQQAIDQLMPVVYQELHKLAASYLRRERSGHTLQPTALIHEVYVRMVRQDAPGWKDRAHFFETRHEKIDRSCADNASARSWETPGSPA